ncbi:MAG: hypothetical protein Q9222_001206 [Ikaeria aurantiellina]
MAFVDILRSYKIVAFLLLVSFVISYIIRRRREHRDIQRLGEYAPYVRNWAPLGLDVVIRTVYYSVNNRDIDLWHYLFSHCSPSLDDRASKTVELRIADERFIFTADPENVKAILATQFQNFGKGPAFFEDWKDFLGHGIFNCDGEAWHDARNLLRPLFVKTKVSELDIFEEHTQQLIASIGGNGHEIDLSDLLYKFTLDTATHYLLGRSVGSLMNADSSFAQSFNEILRKQTLKIRSGPLRLVVPMRSFWDGLRAINDFIEPFIQDTLSFSIAELEDQAAKSENQTFLHSLARYTKDRKVIRDQLVNILIAGRDTTAGTLSFLFKELSADPAIYAKLRQEILSKIGPQRAPTYDDIKNLPYLQHVMNETLRLYPPLPMNIRVASAATTLPRGGGKDGLSPVGIPNKTPVVYSPLYLQRFDHSQYPPVSQEFPDIGIFCPERWEQQFALTEVGYTVVRILQRFERMSKYWTEEDDVLKSDILLSPKNGVRVGFWEADQGIEKR